MSRPGHFDPAKLGKNVDKDLARLVEWLWLTAAHIVKILDHPGKLLPQIEYSEIVDDEEVVIGNFFSHFSVLDETQALHWTDACLAELAKLRDPEHDGPDQISFVAEAEWVLAPVYKKLAEHCQFRVLQQDGDVAVWRNRHAYCVSSQESLRAPLIDY